MEDESKRKLEEENKKYNKYEIKRPFESEEENQKFIKFYKQSFLKNVDKITLSLDKDVIEFLEMFITALTLEINKRFPEPNYSFYCIYRVKSAKSNIDKLEDYIKRLQEENSEVKMKDITDLIGIRIIVEKIPHNVSVSKKNPNYKELQELQQQRKQNLLYSEECHDFETSIIDGECTVYEYYQKSKELLNHIYSMLDEGEEYPEYAIKLKETYKELIEYCQRNMDFLEVAGTDEEIVRKSTKNKSFYVGNKNLSKQIDYTVILKDFDARIDSKFALKLYSSALPNIIKSSESLRGLGASVDTDSSRTKKKREKSGYVADFFGIDFKGIPINLECQIMYIDEYLASTLGYSAHSNMPGKNHMPLEIPPAYVKKKMKLLKSFNDDNMEKIDTKRLSLLRYIISLKELSLEEKTIINNIINRKMEDKAIPISKSEREALENIVSLTDEQSSKLKEELYKVGEIRFFSWAEHISAHHATARLDKDSSAKDRVKIYYDSPYECLAHILRQQIEGYKLEPLESKFIELYLGKIYEKQEEWLENKKINKIDNSSIMEFELADYIKNKLPELKKSLSDFDKRSTVIFEGEEK